MTEIKRRKDLYGAHAVRFAWVKAHIGIMGNEGADKAAKEGTIKDTQGEITEGGLRQELKELRKINRTGEGLICVSG